MRASSSSTPGPGDSLAIRADPRDGIFVEGLTSVTVRNRAELLALVRHGAKMRATSSTIVVSFTEFFRIRNQVGLMQFFKS